MPSRKQYWFPAKRYGWGWGLPSSWQGWIVLFIFIAMVALGFFVFPPDMQLGLLPRLCRRPHRVARRNMLAKRRTSALALGRRRARVACRSRAYDLPELPMLC